ncbi:MAG: ABC transporter ATP-binding protein [Actinobacteria bacterium]|nr:ABC transporter ATP-binding protein [Actinomycetota bacterium]
MNEQAVIAVEHVEREFSSRGQQVLAVDDVSFDVESGEFFTIVGPSGCGKSTLLNMMVGLLQPTSGRILYKGDAVRGVTGEIGYVTQEDNLFPWRTLRKNVEFGMEVRGVATDEREERAEAIIKRVGLDGFQDRFRHELSGGMRARVNIARTLAWRPDVILMDEPFGPLDVQTRLQLQTLLLDLWREDRATVIFITHDLNEAVTLSDRVLVMTRHPGTVKMVYDVDLERPRDVFSIPTTDTFREVFDPLWDELQTEMREDAEEDSIGL